MKDSKRNRSLKSRRAKSVPAISKYAAKLDRPVKTPELSEIKRIHWIGYIDGAIPSDSEHLVGTYRADDGNLYVKDTFGNIFNVHHKVASCGYSGNQIVYLPGVYPVRWKLSELEGKKLTGLFGE